MKRLGIVAGLTPLLSKTISTLLFAGALGTALAGVAAATESAPPRTMRGPIPPPSALPQSANCPSLLKRSFLRLQDEVPQSLCQYAGQVILVVNTASYCGFTKQYDGLEKLHARFKARGFTVLGFPTNDFGGQEPGSNAQIAEFCSNTYGVKFPMFAKTTLEGSGANPLFTDLVRDTGTSVKWNFYKYLIGRDGKVVAAYSSMTDPLAGDLVKDIESRL